MTIAVFGADILLGAPLNLKRLNDVGRPDWAYSPSTRFVLLLQA